MYIDIYIYIVAATRLEVLPLLCSFWLKSRFSNPSHNCHIYEKIRDRWISESIINMDFFMPFYATYTFADFATNVTNGIGQIGF